MKITATTTTQQPRRQQRPPQQTLTEPSTTPGRRPRHHGNGRVPTNVNVTEDKQILADKSRTFN